MFIIASAGDVVEMASSVCWHSTYRQQAEREGADEFRNGNGTGHAVVRSDVYFCFRYKRVESRSETSKAVAISQRRRRSKEAELTPARAGQSARVRSSSVRVSSETF